MKLNEAIDEAGRLKGLFPGLTAEREEFWVQQFKRFAVEPVRIAVEKFAAQYSDFVDSAGLLAAIENEAAAGGNAVAERMREAMLQAREREAVNRKLAEAAEKSLAAVDEVLARLSDEDLAALAQRVIDAHTVLNPAMGKFLKSDHTGRQRDPRTSRILRIEMAAMLRE